MIFIDRIKIFFPFDVIPFNFSIYFDNCCKTLFEIIGLASLSLLLGNLILWLLRLIFLFITENTISYLLGPFIPLFILAMFYHQFYIHKLSSVFISQHSRTIKVFWGGNSNIYVYRRWSNCQYMQQFPWHVEVIS